MKTAAQYLDAIKQAKGIDSDYGIHKLTGWDKGTVSRYRNGKGHFDEDAAMTVADLLDIDPAQVLIDAAASRMHDPRALRAWQSVLSRIGAAGIAAGVGVSALLGSPAAEAARLCIMSTGKRATTRRRPGFRPTYTAAQQQTEKAANRGLFL